MVASTKPMKNIVDAYELIREHVRKPRFDNLSSVQKYYEYLIEKVKIVRVKTRDAEQKHSGFSKR